MSKYIQDDFVEEILSQMKYTLKDPTDIAEIIDLRKRLDRLKAKVVIKKLEKYLLRCSMNNLLDFFLEKLAFQYRDIPWKYDHFVYSISPDSDDKVTLCVHCTSLQDKMQQIFALTITLDGDLREIKHINCIIDDEHGTFEKIPETTPEEKN